MAEKKLKVKFGDEFVTATDVPIEETTERWTEIKLKDGAILRMKTVISSVSRIDDKTDQNGNPVYAVSSTNVIAIVSGPTEPENKKVH